MCGGNASIRKAWSTVSGLSPRVRGKLCQHPQLSAAAGSIPACAGETSSRLIFSVYAAVYPRVCGGKRSLTDRFARLWGSIPACAGET